MDPLRFVIQQLPYLAPSLIVYLVGIVLSLIYLKRSVTPAVLVLIASLLLFVVTLIIPVVQGYLIQNRRGFEGFDWMMVVGICGSLLRSVGFALLLAAALVGRPNDSHNSSATRANHSESPSGGFLEPHRATLVLVFGILSLIICAPLGIAAWVMGSNDLAAMRFGRMDNTGESMTRVGYILGIIGTVIFGVGIVGTCLWFVVAGIVVQGVR